MNTGILDKIQETLVIYSDDEGRDGVGLSTDGIIYEKKRNVRDNWKYLSTSPWLYLV